MISLLDVRAKAAAALAPLSDTDPEVLSNLVDSLEPPALMITWGDPWLEPNGQAPASWARLVIVAVAGRLEPGAGVEKLEELVAYTVGRFVADRGAWPPATTSAPRAFELGGVRYLSAEITYRIAVAYGSEGI